MTDSEKLLNLIKVLKDYAESEHCYDIYGSRYTPSNAICYEYAFDDGVEYGEINLTHTLLEQICETFEYPCGGGEDEE